MPSTHIIYHIPGRKVGCTKDLQARRLMYQEKEGQIPTMEILEELHDKTDQEAGDIEWQWVDKLGFRRGVHYAVTIRGLRIRGKNGKPENRSKAGKVGGRNASHDDKVKAGRLGGLAGKGRRISGRQYDELIGRNPFYLVVKCPHCELQGNLPSMKRWHFDNCKFAI
jgi:hypothetical protein